MRRAALTLTVLLPLLGCPAPEVRPTPPPEVQPEPPALLLRVELQGFRSDVGLARVSLFEAPEGFPEDPSRARRVWVGPIQGGRCSLEWAGLEPGTYAVAAIHDEDGDERLDRGLFGVPQEGFGVSNDPPVRLGLPRFEDAIFRLEPPGRELRVSIHYF
jgi:uncharacterized protein (DUF2141 family)